MIKRILLIVILLIISSGLSGQPITGTVTYQQISKLDFDTVFDEQGMNAITEYFGGEVPESKKQQKRLFFTETASLFENDPRGEATDVRIQNVQMRMDMMRPPRPKLEKVYFDFTKEQKIEQVEFMTRHFRIVDEINKPAWKLTDKSTKILDYTCMGAELKKGEDVFVAYFTPEIPISLGPDEFVGLPGLVLAVEKNGETVYLATSVSLDALEEDAVAEPQDGQKVTQDEFDEIVKEKVMEYEETRRHPQRGTDRR